jgi:hypothetical protein
MEYDQGKVEGEPPSPKACSKKVSKKKKKQVGKLAQ